MNVCNPSNPHIHKDTATCYGDKCICACISIYECFGLVLVFVIVIVIVIVVVFE